MLKNIKFLFLDFIDFVRKDFHLAAYVYTLLIVAASVLFIYTTDIGINIGHNRLPTSSTIINNMMMFVILYFLVAIPTLIIRKEFHTISKPAFLLKALLLTLLIGFADAFNWRNVLDMQSFSAPEQSYILKVLWRTRNATFVLPVLILLRIFMDKQTKGLYGLCSGNHHVRAYLCLYIVILPLLIGVSFTNDFLSYYPYYKPWIFQNVFDNPVWLNTLIAETVYMSDFLMVELIFRGALVIGMVKLLGRSAVLPMVAVYVGLHFGKPVMETISALFGGFFLGALAFQTRHIWGGVIIHMGIALVIELLRFFQHYVLGIG